MAPRGYSLLELLIVLTLISVALLAGTPALRSVVLDSRRTTDINALVGAIQLARSESARRSLPVVLCSTEDGETCGKAGEQFVSGWMVFVDADLDAPPQRDTDEPLLFVHRPAMTGSIRANRPYFTFRPRFTRSTNGTVTFCDARGAASARAVIVSYTGRPRISDRTAGGRSLVCAS